jgi:lipoyl(octanoyl) transferase
MIGLFADYGLTTGRVRGRSGVWLAAAPSTTRPERKIAAIGVRVAGGTTMHGLAINVDPDLAGFGRIVPCGLNDVGVTSMAAELGEASTLPEVAHLLRPHLERMLSFEPYEQSPDLAAASPVSYGLTVGAT